MKGDLECGVRSSRSYRSRVFLFYIPKSGIMQDFVSKNFTVYIWTRECGCNPLEGIGCFIL